MEVCINCFPKDVVQQCVPGILVDRQRLIKPPEWVTNEDARLSPDGIASVSSPFYRTD